MGEEPPKKDLTSLLELSALELQKNPHLGEPGGDPAMQIAPIEKITEADFGDLETLSKLAAKEAAENPPPPEPEPAAPLADASAPELSIDPMAAPALDAAPAMASLETAPGEAPAGAIPPGGDAVPSFLDSAPGTAPAPEGADRHGAQPSPPGTQSFDLPSFSQIGTGEPQAAGAPLEGLAPAEGAPPTPELSMPQMAINEGFPSAPQPVPEMPAQASAPAAPEHAPEHTPEPVADVPSEPAPSLSELAGDTGNAPRPEPKSKLDPHREPVKAAPAGASHTVKGVEPARDKQDMAALKKFGEKLAIGRPKIEGAPAFSLLAHSASGHFDEKTIKAIENAVTSEDFGIRIEDIAIQLSAGKLLVPQISEFAAITLAQKLRDAIENIEVDLAAEIFKSSSAEVAAGDESILLDTEEFETHHEEVHDIGAEPRSEDDLFTTNMPELSDFQTTRILSVVMGSEIIPAEVAENTGSKEFELATEKLTQELIARAFKLGAHGVLGVNFTMRTIDAYRDVSGKVRRAYRLLGTGTAVRVRRKQ